MVGPLTVSLVLVWVWPHSLAAQDSTIYADRHMHRDGDARRSPRARLSYHRDTVTLWLQGLNVSQ